MNEVASIRAANTDTSDIVTEEFMAASPEEALDKYSKGLLRKMHLTKGARFQAARRHRARAIASVWSIIFLSMYVFSSSVAGIIYAEQVTLGFSQFLNMLNVIMSAFIIAFSVFEQGKQHDLKAELFLKCAQEISRLHDNLYYEACMHRVTPQSAQAFNEAYQKTVNGFSDNHSEVDYRTFRINSGNHKGEPLFRAINTFRYWFDCWSIMIAAVLAPPAVLALYAFVARAPVFK